MSKQKITILYERLSRDDELQGPSNSILNQKLQLEEYAKANGLTPYIHIDDDGYSGTNWNRPGWQELITKVEADEVACIVMKDSSRMGRDYLRMGLYRDAYVKHELKKYESFLQNIYICHSSKTKQAVGSHLPRLPVLLFTL